MLLVKRIQRFEHPTEPGAWFDVRVPLDTGVLEKLGNANNTAEIKVRAVEITLIAWSYPAPITPETFRSLDPKSLNWLADQVFEAAELLSDESKNVLSANSSPTTDPEEAPSLVSAGI